MDHSVTQLILVPGFGDRKTYQMDYHNPREAMRDIQDDIDEGADIIIIKPALAFLDILKQHLGKQTCHSVHTM